MPDKAVSPEPTGFLVLTPRLDGRDGVSEVSRQVCRALETYAGSDHVEVWALDGTAPDAGKQSPAFRVRSADGARWRLVHWTLSRALRHRTDVAVVTMHLHLAPLGAAVAGRDAPSAVFLHGIEAWRPLRPRERFALRRASIVIANSEHTVERFRAANADMRDRHVAVCPLGVCERSHGRSIHGSIPAGFALIVGRLCAAERYKGHDRLVDIWPAVRARVPGGRLVIAGDGDDLPRLKARVAAAGLDEAIQFTGQVSERELEALYEASAFFVMPSTGEGFGLAYLQAMRAARPCIALRGAASEIMEDGISGLLLDDGRSEALTEAIVRLFGDERLRRRLGAAAAARVAARFTEHHFARRFRDALGLPVVTSLDRADSRAIPAPA